jgi:hypothetical protein
VTKKGVVQLDNLGEVIAKLEKASGIYELSKVTTFKGYLEGAGEIEIEVSERPGNYHIFARTLDLEVEKTATGNSGDDLDTTISLVHWGDLKR